MLALCVHHFVVSLVSTATVALLRLAVAVAVVQGHGDDRVQVGRRRALLALLGDGARAAAARRARLDRGLDERVRQRERGVAAAAAVGLERVVYRRRRVLFGLGYAAAICLDWLLLLLLGCC